VKKSRPAIFLDRDGTLLTERGYLSDPRKIKFYRGTAAALRSLQKAGFRLIVVTNQSGIGRGYFSEKTFGEINRRFLALLRARAVVIDGVYYCPHAPSAGCRCRKPKPYLLRRAAARWKIPVASSYVIGDQMTDIDMAVAAGARPVLVLTGSGRRNRTAALRRGAKIAAHIGSAAAWVLSRGAIR
jgi:D,D-heptose 1,7-bisphosphate phosphatase